MGVWLHVSWGEESPTVGSWPVAMPFSLWVCGTAEGGDLNYFYQHFLWNLAISLLSSWKGITPITSQNTQPFVRRHVGDQEMLNSQALERIGRGRMFWTQEDIGTLSKRWSWMFSPVLHHNAAQLPVAPLHSRFFCLLIILLLALKFDLYVPLLASLIPLYGMTSSGAIDSVRFLQEKNLLGSAHLPRPCRRSPARLPTLCAQSK